MDLNQDKFFNLIQKEIDESHISQAYLIETGNNENVDLIIKKMLKMLLCKEKFNENCNKCNICELIDINGYPDVKIIEPDGNYIKKEQLIDIKNQFSKRSMFDGKQIYVIKEANKLNPSSANTILKFLEEPEDDIIAILLTQNRYMVLDTIISRCQVLSLEENYIGGVTSDIIDLMNTLFLKNKGFLVYNEILDIVPDRNEFLIKMKKVEQYLFFVINKKVDLIEQYNDLSDEKIYKILLIIEKYLEKMQYNINYKLTIDSFIIEINEVM